MKKGHVTNSLIAICFLFVAVIAVGVIIRNIAQADVSTVNVSSEGATTSNFSPLKVGENQFVAVNELTMKSPIIGINGSLLTFKEAKERGILTSVYLFEGRKVLDQDISKIEPDQQFAILVNDISLSPTIYLEGVK